MPRGVAAELTVERVISKKHRAEVLRALANAKSGLPHHTIQYEVVRGSVASTILVELRGLGLVEWHNGIYQATAKGRDTIAAFDRFRVIASGSSGNGGAGVH